MATKSKKKPSPPPQRYKSIFLRVNHLESGDIEKAMDQTGIKTASQAILRAVHEYPDLRKQLSECQNELRLLRSQHRNMVEVVEDYTTALKRLHDIRSVGNQQEEEEDPDEEDEWE